MRKPLLALSLVFSAGIGASPVANVLAATQGNHLEAGAQPQTATSPSYTAYTGTQAAHSTSNAVSGAAIVSTALKYLGYPYTAVGNSPSTGFSCIGFVSFVYRSNGIPLPGDLQDALAYAPQVPFSQLEPGDILYFQNTVWNGLSHAAIYIGGGKFVHAEWYNRGVVVSSFNNDATDGSYWIGKYLGANRPWGGASVGAVIAPPSTPAMGAIPSKTSTTSTTTVSPGTQALTGPQALVSVQSLNVRSGPSKSSSVQKVVVRGTTMTIVGKQNGWYKVQLSDGSIGWVIAAGIGKGSTPASVGTTSVTGVNGVGPNPTIGTSKTPARIQGPTKPRPTTAVRVSGLRVHTGPSTASPVVTVAARGQHLQVISRRNGWMLVRMPDGTTGWVSGAYATRPHPTTKQLASTVKTATVKTSGSASFRSVARQALNVRSAPSMSGSVMRVMVPGSAYRVLGWSGGWMHVQFPDGTTGWVNGAAAGKSGAPKTASVRTVASTTSRSATHAASAASQGVGGAVITAGVRVHARPALKSAVVTLAAAGTHIRVLGYSGAWVLVRLPSGTTGYVSAAYVR